MSVSLIEDIKNKVDIVDVVSEYMELERKGKNFQGLCPFHQDSNPSMSVSQEKQIFKCFTCGQGGNVITFVSEYEKIPFGKALSKLGARVGIEVKNNFEETPKYSPKQQELTNVLNEANNFFQYSITTEEGKEALEYADSRGLTHEIREKFKIGYAPSSGLVDYLRNKGFDDAVIINASLMNQQGTDFYKGRLTYALSNKFGDVIGFSGRILKGDGPKYINSVESLVFNKSETLYNFNNSKDTIFKTKEVYILEGFMDVIALYKAGMSNSVAIMGTALTQQHIKSLQGNSVTLMLDTDVAGLNATMKSISLLLKNNIKSSVIYIKQGKDADEILRQDGKEKLIKLINESKKPALEFVYAFLKRKHGVSSVDGINELIKEFKTYLENANELERDFYIGKIATDFNLSNQAISNQFAFSQPKQYKSEYVKPKPVKPITDVIIPKKNYSYMLIRSMAMKPMLIDQIIEHKVDFGDHILTAISKWMIAKKNNEKRPITDEMKKKMEEIKEESDEVILDPTEFVSAINIINKLSNSKRINTNIVELKEQASCETREQSLIKIIEMKRKNRK